LPRVFVLILIANINAALRLPFLKSDLLF
jgi:hypothetical protein